MEHGLKNVLPPPSLVWWLLLGMLSPRLYWPWIRASALKLIPPRNLPMAKKYNWCPLWTRIVSFPAMLHHNISSKIIQLHVIRKTTIWDRVKSGYDVAWSHWLLTFVRWGKSMGCGVEEWLWASQKAKGLSRELWQRITFSQSQTPNSFFCLKGTTVDSICNRNSTSLLYFLFLTLLNMAEYRLGIKS